MSEVRISSGKLWAGLGTLAGLLLLGGVAVWHERDSRIEASVEQIQAERQATLQKYLESKEKSQAAIERRMAVYEELVDRLEKLPE